MGGINPFARPAESETAAVYDLFVDEPVTVQEIRERATTFQRFVAAMFSGGVEHLPPAPFAFKNSIRRRRRERGRAKAARRA
jgi:hypothetical protein